MDNSPLTLPGLTKEQQIGQLDPISSSFLNLSSRTWDDVRYKGKKKDKLTPVVNTPVAHSMEDRHKVASVSATNDDTLPS